MQAEREYCCSKCPASYVSSNHTSKCTTCNKKNNYLLKKCPNPICFEKGFHFVKHYSVKITQCNKNNASQFKSSDNSSTKPCKVKYDIINQTPLYFQQTSCLLATDCNGFPCFVTLDQEDRLFINLNKQIVCNEKSGEFVCNLYEFQPHPQVDNFNRTRLSEIGDLNDDRDSKKEEPNNNISIDDTHSKELQSPTRGELVPLQSSPQIIIVESTSIGGEIASLDSSKELHSTSNQEEVGEKNAKMDVCCDEMLDADNKGKDSNHVQPIKLTQEQRKRILEHIPEISKKVATRLLHKKFGINQ